MYNKCASNSYTYTKDVQTVQNLQKPCFLYIQSTNSFANYTKCIYTNVNWIIYISPEIISENNNNCN